MTNPGRQFKDAIYEQFARIGKAVSSPARLEILDLLCQSERTVEALSKEANMTVANASQHLRVLRNARLVTAEKQGLFVMYRMADSAVCDFFRAMRELAEDRLADVEQISKHFLAGKEGMEPIDRRALLRRVRDGAVTVLDVRPVEEYRSGHLPHAISIPLKELRRRLSELSRNQEIVAYCRGPYCVLAMEAVRILRKNGFHAVRLEDGVHEWRARGLPLSRGKEGKK